MAGLSTKGPKFMQDLLKNYQFISRSRQSDEFVKCCCCGIDINVVGGEKRSNETCHIKESQKELHAACETQGIIIFCKRTR